MRQTLENNVRSWICVVNSENFDIIIKERVYGIPDRKIAVRQFSNIKKGDILFFYVISPTMRILGMCNVVSDIYEEEEKTPWNDRLYPFRVRTSKIKPINIRSKDFLGKISSIGNRIPMGSSVIPLSNSDYEILMSLAQNQLK